VADRHYLPSAYPASPGRPVILEDLGNTLKIAGVVFQGMGATVVMLSPSGEKFEGHFRQVQPTVSEWGDIIRASDDPQLFVGEAGGINKILHRKLRHEISGFTQQRVWHREGFKCICCGKGLPDVQLSVDHWLPLAEGGKNDVSNYVTMCKRDNKNKGDMPPQEFCQRFGHDYDRIAKYVEALQ